MGIDHARHGYHVPSVDSFAARYSKVLPHSDNFAGAHVEVAARQISQRRVHCQDLRAPHDKFTAVGKLRRSAVRCSYARPLRGLRSAASQANRPERRYGAQKSAPADGFLVVHLLPPTLRVLRARSYPVTRRAVKFNLLAWKVQHWLRVMAQQNIRHLSFGC
jgi:hypothetical protein